MRTDAKHQSAPTDKLGAKGAKPYRVAPFAPNPTADIETELRSLVALVYADDTEADIQDALAYALADPDDALTCYRAIAQKRGLK